VAKPRISEAKVSDGSIRQMTDDERQRAKERSDVNKGWNDDGEDKFHYLLPGHLEAFCIAFAKHVMDNPEWLEQGREVTFDGVMRKGKGRLGPIATRGLIDEIFNARGL